LNEWPVASTRIWFRDPARATMAWSSPSVAGRWKSRAAKTTLPAQFVRGRGADPTFALTFLVILLEDCSGAIASKPIAQTPAPTPPTSTSAAA
jgi:hypothetical protein